MLDKSKKWGRPKLRQQSIGCIHKRAGLIQPGKACHFCIIKTYDEAIRMEKENGTLRTEG